MVNRKGLIVLLLALCVAPFSFAASITDLFDRHGFAIYPTANAVSVQAPGASINAVAANGSRAVVPVTAAAQVGKATIAANAVRIARAGTAIGIAWTAWDTYNAIKDSGVTVCPAPDFFCKPGEAPAPVAPTGALYDAPGSGTLRFNSAREAAVWRADEVYKQNGCTSPGYYCPTADSIKACTVYSGSYECLASGVYFASVVGNKYGTDTNCPTGSTLTNGSCVFPSTTAGPMTDAEFQNKLTESEWDAAKSKRFWDAVHADSARMSTPLTTKEKVGATSPVTVSGSPVSGPEVTTSTRTYSNGDGTTSTEVKKEKTTFTPANDGGPTVSDGNVTAKESTVITTTVTNNTTNNVTTSTTTVTPAGDAEKPPTDDLCKTNPDIVACKKLGELAPVDVPNENKPVVITQDSGWGMSDAACPAPGQITAMGQVIEVPWDYFCQFAHGIRPFLIAFAYMAAIGGFLGLGRRD